MNKKMNNKRKKLKLKMRFYFFIAILLVIIIGVVYAVFPRGYVTISGGDIGFDGTFDAVIVRNEKIYSEQSFGKIIMNVGEGTKVAKDAKIAEIYQWDYGDRITDELIDIQTQIVKYQEENVLKGIVNKDIEKVRASIDEVVEKIRQVMSGESSEDMLKLEKQLSELKKNEQELLKTISPQNDTQLTNLYAQENNIIERINKSKTDVLAENSGVVSFYFDGAEDILTYDNLENLTKETIQNIIDGKLPTTNNTDGKKSVYRLIDNYKWYMVVLGPDKGINEMVIDEKFQIAFDGIYDAPYTGKLVTVKQLSGATMYAFEFEEDVSPLISTRSGKVKIQKVYSGIKVDSSMIKEQNGVLGVFVEMPYGKTFVKVEVVVNNGDKSIIEFVDTIVPEPIKVYK